MTKEPLHICLLLLAFVMLTSVMAQEATPIPTLAIPTLAPHVGDAPPNGLASQSSVTDIVNSGSLRAGVLFNEPPYSEFTSEGDLRGFDIELIRLIAETWESEVEFVQVTRENALSKLNRAEVHVVASAFVHYRDQDEQLEFSQTYLMGRQAMLVRAESSYETPSQLSSQPVGYVIGTRSEKAFSLWSARLDASLNLRFFLTLDRAFVALAQGEIEGLVAEEQSLLRITGDYADRFRILDEAVVREPRAFAIRRHDIALRHLLSRSIQLLANEGSLQQLYAKYFPEADAQADAIVLWNGIGDSIDPLQYADDLTYPGRYMIPHLSGTGVLRVGGIAQDASAASAGQAQLNALNSAIAHELARRWNVSVEIISSTAEEAQAQLTRGEVDIVAGVKPDWRLAADMDFSAPYLLQGDRLMVPANSQIRGFNDLRGRIIGVIIGDEGARDRAQAWADSINASVRFFGTTESGADNTLLEFNNAHAVYADSLLLVAHLQASPGALSLTDRWYSRSYYAFGLPYNDLDFRLLVDYTIQELALDGTLARQSGALILSDEPPDFEITPGASSYAGFSLSGA